MKSETNKKMTAHADGTLREYFTRGIGIAGDVGSLVAETRFENNAAVSTTYLHSNWRGDVVMATDTAGNVVGEYSYTTFGEQLSATGTYTPRFTFSSKERDVSGLVYHGFRYYSPVLCRWISEDPIREFGGINLYQFCGNDPINGVDPWGLRCEEGSWEEDSWLDRYRQNYNTILNDLYGADLEWADTLGLWGLGSLAVEGSLNVYQSLVEYLAKEQIANAQIAGALGGGNMWQRMANAAAGAEVARRTATLRTGMQAIGRVTAIAGAWATGYSIGARVNAATRAVYQTWQQGGTSP